MRILLTIALIAGVAGCSASDVPFVGPCSASKRSAPDKVYYDLALTMYVRKAWPFDGGKHAILSEADRTSRLQSLDALREAWLPTIADECLHAHVSDWIEFTDRQFRRARITPDDTSAYEDRETEKNDQRRALAERLGVRP